MSYRFLLLALVAGLAALTLPSCSVANAVEGYASRMGSAVTRAVH
jgi:hypothetical protein